MNLSKAIVGTIIVSIFVFIASITTYSQEVRDIELDAAKILAQVDKIFQYPNGLIKGTLKHIKPDGNSFIFQVTGNITKDDFLFTFNSRSRGLLLKVLYKLQGEDIWVYDAPSLKLFHKLKIDKYDSILTTNFYYIDLSNADYRSNYQAKVLGKTMYKGYQTYRLQLKPLFAGGQYGKLTMYVSTIKYYPLRIDFHDKDMAIVKFMTISKIKEKAGKIIPLRYDMMDIRQGTVSILYFYDFDHSIKYNKELFRSTKLGQ